MWTTLKAAFVTSVVALVSATDATPSSERDLMQPFLVEIGAVDRSSGLSPMVRRSESLLDGHLWELLGDARGFSRNFDQIDAYIIHTTTWIGANKLCQYAAWSNEGVYPLTFVWTRQGYGVISTDEFVTFESPSTGSVALSVQITDAIGQWGNAEIVLTVDSSNPDRECHIV